MAEFFPTHNPVGGQTSYRTDMYVALPGMLSGMGSSRILPHMNDVGVVGKYVLAVTSALPNTEYWVLINTEKVTYKSDDNPTIAEISTGIYNAIRMTPTAYRLADISKDDIANTVALTSRILGVPLSISAQGLTVTNPVTGTQIYEGGEVNLLLPFGRFVGRKADYKLDPREGVSSCSLIDAPGDTYEVLGITLRSHHTQQVGTFGHARSGYAFGDTCNVMEDTGTIKGVWTECVEPDLKIGEKPYCAIAPGQKSKLTRDTSGKDLSQVCRIVGATEPTIGGFMALCQFNRYGTW